MPNQAPKDYYGARDVASGSEPAHDASQSSRLHQMRDRLASLSEEARTIRGQVPHEFEPDVERIQQQMQRLGERLSELNSEARAQLGLPQTAQRSPLPAGGSEMPQTNPEEVIRLGGPANEAGAWDQRSMDTLSRIYESGEAFSAGGRAPTAVDPQPASAQPPARGPVEASSAAADAVGRALAPLFPEFDTTHEAPGAEAAGQHSQQAGADAGEPEWLDRRFAEIAERIEQSLAEIRPENSLLALSRRFDDFEMRMSSTLKGVATRADLDELRIAEAQIDDISLQLDQLRRQLARLDAIDSHLGTLAQQLSDERLSRLIGQGAGVGRLEALDAQLASIATQLSSERLSGLFRESAGPAADIENVAAAAAEKAAQRFSDQGQSQAQTHDLGEVRGLIESLINERRHHDENNASMLETMQQAIIRVLDRIDALEPSHQHARDMSEPDQDAAPGYEPAQSVEEGEAQSDYGYEPPPAESFFAEQDEPPPVPQAEHEQTTDFVPIPFDLEQAFGPDAHQQTGGYTGPNPSPQAEAAPRQVEMLRHDFIADAHKAKLRAASKVEGSLAVPVAEADDVEPEPAKKPRRRSVLRSPRVVMVVLTLLAVIPAALFFMPRTPADKAAVPAAVEVLPLSSETGNATTGSSSDDSEAGEGPGAPGNAAPEKQSQQIEQLNGPFEDAGSPALHPGRAMMTTGATRQAGAMSTTPPLMSAALMKEGVQAREDDQSSPFGGTDANRLPPATVGPFSLRLAAAQGDASAQFEVANRLGGAKGTAQDLKESAQWYERSAASGFPMAQFRLATFYERGIGVEQDFDRARVWYGRAAEQGNLKAMHNLAVLAASRSGPAPDYATAATWFTRAAEHGLADSQYNLAVLYENGLGVEKDLKEAYKWLSLAAKAGDEDAIGRLEAVTAKLDSKDREAIDAVTRGFRAKPSDRIANDAGIAGQAWRRQHGTGTNG